MKYKGFRIEKIYQIIFDKGDNEDGQGLDYAFSIGQAKEIINKEVEQ